MKHLTQINDLGVLYPVHLSNDRYLLGIAIRRETAGFHDRLENRCRTFEHDLAWLLHLTRDHYRDRNIFQSHYNIAILQLGFIKVRQLFLELSRSFTYGVNLSDQGQADCPVRFYFFRLIELWRRRERYLDDVAWGQNSRVLAGGAFRQRFASICLATRKD